MTIDDKGPNPSIFDLETETTTNENYRTVAWSGKYLQVTLMSIPVGESVGLEAHRTPTSSCAWTPAKAAW